ncbi:uncharacterized protein [Eucyclogobius newberryi]|uniref:uncharacterized protein isoform X2 n=1 Tax=Eucyclogobius newberryi TaxID=166745 RepID=UPI003B5A137F
MSAVCCLHLVSRLFTLFTLSSADGWCPDPWLCLRDRCVAAYPVWATWSDAETLCAQSNSHLFSLHSNDDMEFLQKITVKLGVPVWTGGYSVAHERNSWLWSDGSDFRLDVWTVGKNDSDAACLGMGNEDSEMRSAPCGEMRFYICARHISGERPDANEEAAAPFNLSPGVGLVAAMWSHSEPVADEILRSSSFLLRLASGSITRSCYDLFRRQEALYVGLVYKTLEAFDLQRINPDVGSLLLDTKERYKIKYSKQAPVTAPQWLQFALLSFHPVVVDDPLYLLVALSAREALNSFVLESLPLPGSVPSAESRRLYQRWREESERDVQSAKRFKDVIENYQNKMDVYKSINVFRHHMMNQKSLHKNTECEE